MKRHHVIKARVELVLAVIFAGLAVLTMIWQTWFESLTGLEPDNGSGETEWGFVAAFAVLAIAAALLSRRHYRMATTN